MCEAQAAQHVLGVTLGQLADKVGEMWGLPDSLRGCMATPQGDVPRRSLNGRPEHHGWLASLSNAATEAMMHTELAALGEVLQALQTRYAAALDLHGSGLQDAAGRARKRMTELTEALNFAVPPHTAAERLIDPYHVVKAAFKVPLVLKRKGQPELVLGLIYADQAHARGFQVRDRELSLLRTLRNQAVMAFKQTTGQ
jgi:hypothetical protein